MQNKKDSTHLIKQLKGTNTAYLIFLVVCYILQSLSHEAYTFFEEYGLPSTIHPNLLVHTHYICS